MILLLDTVALLRAAVEPELLGRQAEAAMADSENSRLLSAATTWEIAIKHAAGRLILEGGVASWIALRKAELTLADIPITAKDVLAAAALPRLHADLFDRMLVAQALAHGAVLVTNDTAIRRYSVPTLW